MNKEQGMSNKEQGMTNKEQGMSNKEVLHFIIHNSLFLVQYSFPCSIFITS